MPPRAPTAYFIFAGEVRDAVREEIAATNGGKASVALVGKAVGERWKALTDEQKQHYKDIAAEKAREVKGAFVSCIPIEHRPNPSPPLFPAPQSKSQRLPPTVPPMRKAPAPPPPAALSSHPLAYLLPWSKRLR